MGQMRVNEAAARRKCGRLFVRSLGMAARGEGAPEGGEGALYDDDAILSLY